MIRLIDQNVIDQTIQNAKNFPRKRSIYRFHETDNEKIQRMLNAIEPDSYMCPHKHERPEKIEIFICLTGKLLALEFDDKGSILNHQIFGEKENVRGVEFPVGTWHCVWSLEEGSVVYEIIEGPYNAFNHKKFAPFAPKEEEVEKGLEYMKGIMEKLGLE